LSESIVTYKGFSKEWKCRDFQFEVGKEYIHEGKVQACASGFHSCEYPLDTFNYYAPSESVYAICDAGGETSKERGGDSKVASRTLKIKAQLSFHDLVKASIDFIYKNVDKSLEQSNTGNYSAASNTGNYSAASNTGNYSAASNTGYQSAASNTGDYSAASNTGNYSAASNTGYRSAASNTGDRSAASNTGNYSAASNTGNYSAASNTGYQSAASVSGKDSVAAVFGYDSKAKASKGSWIVVAYRDKNMKLKHLKTAQAGVTRGVKADTWYKLDSKGKFIEVSE